MNWCPIPKKNSVDSSSCVSSREKSVEETWEIVDEEVGNNDNVTEEDL